ncbi:hypothetical protein BV20DRAFT_1124630 [Pilatotrama ljubarskyi]|nr:hypothetical protein BV20DRAFT_1124630 [Pilatotrama ljubarskyi]
MSTLTSSQSTVAENVITNLKRSLTDLRATLGSLDENTVQSIRQGAEAHINSEIKGLREHMTASDKKQEVDIKEINDLLKQVLEEEVVRELTKIIEAGVLQEIDDLVQEQVREQLPRYLAEDLQKEVETQKEELARLERELHNAESIRANAALALDPDLPLQPLHNTCGEVSEKFPKTLGDLFNMTEETAVVLLHDYGLDSAIMPGPNSREKNVNEFMQFCGVRYRLVPFGDGSAMPCSPTTGLGRRFW